MRILLILALLFSFFSISISNSTKDNQIIIIFTNDEHANISNYNFSKSRYQKSGMPYISTLVKNVRKEYPNALLLSAGDTFHGTPLAYYYRYLDTVSVNPIVKAMNYLKYDAFTIGNHDIEQSVEYLKKIETQSDFLFLSANTNPKNRTDTSVFQPYFVKEINGVKIAVLGLSTPVITLWLDEELYPGIQFTDMVQSAQYWIDRIKKTEQPDIMVGLFHSGMNEEWDKEVCEKSGLPLANATLLVAEAVPEFDLIINGHSHRLVNDSINEEFPDSNIGNYINGTWFAQSEAYCRYLGVCSIQVSRNSHSIEVDTIIVKTIPANSVEVDEKFVELISEDVCQVKRYIQKPIGYTHKNYSAFNSRYKDNELTDLIHRVQLEVTRAQISIASNFNPHFRINSGVIKVSDIYNLYYYENSLITTQLSGRQIKDYLEFNAKFYNQIDPGVQEIDIKELLYSKVPNYNYDTFEGIEYIIDIREPLGNRIGQITLDGVPIEPDSFYTVAMNSYRFNGGGGFVASLGIGELPVIKKEFLPVRDLIIQYIEQKDTIELEATNNWKLIPDNLEIR